MDDYTQTIKKEKKALQTERLTILHSSSNYKVELQHIFILMMILNRRYMYGNQTRHRTEQ